MRLRALIAVLICVTTTAAQLYCDPLTQYEKEGRCCLKCGPGSRMTTIGSCEEPLCKECGVNEYQETHTSDTLCKRQPYCDPNRNFMIPVHPSKKSQAPCVCERGFHCSSDQCLTCVPHASCPPGTGAKTKGNHSQDTVCQKCPHGWFSNESSWDGVCEEWTKCEEGHYEKEKGSDVFDIQCAKPNHSEIIIIIVVTGVVAVLSAVAAYFVCQHKKRTVWRNPKLPLEEQQHLKNSTITTPEENEDQPTVPEGIGLTVHGNFVTQENGKTHITSWQESQPEEV